MFHPLLATLSLPTLLLGGMLSAGAPVPLPPPPAAAMPAPPAPRAAPVAVVVPVAPLPPVSPASSFVLAPLAIAPASTNTDDEAIEKIEARLEIQLEALESQREQLERQAEQLRQQAEVQMRSAEQQIEAQMRALNEIDSRRPEFEKQERDMERAMREAERAMAHADRERSRNEQKREAQLQHLKQRLAQLGSRELGEAPVDHSCSGAACWRLEDLGLGGTVDFRGALRVVATTPSGVTLLLSEGDRLANGRIDAISPYRLVVQTDAEEMLSRSLQ